MVDGDEVERRVSSLLQHQRQALENIHVAQDRQVRQHARRHGLEGRSSAFSVNDEVLWYNSRRDTRRGDRIKRPWRGPYRIMRVVGSGTYRLVCIDTGKEIRQVVNGSNLRPYRRPNQPRSNVQVVVPPISLENDNE